MGSISVMAGDVYDLLPSLSGEKQFHAVLTDPPYELGDRGFMSQKWDTNTPAKDPEFWSLLRECLYPGALVFCFAGSRRYHWVASAAEQVGFEVMPLIAWVYGTGMGFGKRHEKYKSHIVGAQAFRPAVEPIVVLQKSTDGKSKSYCLEQYGTGGINVDASMVRTAGKSTMPSNVLVDEYAEKELKTNVFRQIYSGVLGVGIGAVYSPKATTAERDGGLSHLPLLNHGIYEARKAGTMTGGVRLKRNPHPTVKPQKLLLALANMLLPPPEVNGSVLVPFSGSGSEIIALHNAGFTEVVGIEKEPEYVEVSKHRIKFHTGVET